MWLRAQFENQKLKETAQTLGADGLQVLSALYVTQL